MRRSRGWLAVVASAIAVAGCASAVTGTGHVGGPTVSQTGPNVTITVPPVLPNPSGSTSIPREPTCPHISYPAGRLAFDCITGAQVYLGADKIWPFALVQTVEPEWVLSEAARPLEPLRGRTLRQIAVSLRTQMIAAEDYGVAPAVRTESAAAATVAGVPAFVLRTAFTINPSYRAENGLHVRVERLWIVVLNAGDGQVAAWSISVPDDVSSLWAEVPAVIKSLGLI